LMFLIAVMRSFVENLDARARSHLNGGHDTGTAWLHATHTYLVANANQFRDLSGHVRREMHLSVVTKDESIRFSVWVQKELGDGAARLQQAFRVNPMHGVAPIKIGISWGCRYTKV